MKFQKIVNFLDTNSDNKYLLKFVTIKTSMIRSNLCDFSDAYIVLREILLLLKKHLLLMILNHQTIHNLM